MKQVTLAELAELARNDKALEQKILEASKKIGGGSYRDALRNLASELGFDLILEEKMDGLEEVSDDALDQVAGGIFFGNAFCVFMMDLFGYNGKEYCD